MAALFEELPGAVLHLNTQGSIVCCNKAAVECLGQPLVGEYWRDVRDRAFSEALHQGELMGKNNRLYSISTSPLSTIQGQVVLLTDVSEVRGQQRRLDRESRLIMLGEMIARLAHQVRTPLSAAMLYLSQVERLSDNRERTLGVVGRAQGRLRHMEQMVRDMLMFTHGSHFKHEKISVQQLLAEVRHQIFPIIEQTQASLVIHSDSETSLYVSGNKVALSAALLNLVHNALEHSEQMPLIHIEVSSEQGQLLIQVEDNGTGVPDTDKDRIFEPFFTTRSDGTGLGLPVVKAVLGNHQGDLKVKESRYGGACFQVRLPLADAAQ